VMSLYDFFKPLPNIALTAKMRAGKDEVFKILAEMGFDVERVAFGDPMKEHFFMTFPNIPREPKPIEQLQKYGQAMRAIYNNVWVDKAMAHIQKRTQELAQAGLSVPTFVFTDVRQPNEYQAVREAGFIVVRVEAPEELRIKRMIELGEKVTKEILNAETEQYIDTYDVDYVICNDGTREDLVKEVIELVFQIQSKRLKGNEQEKEEKDHWTNNQLKGNVEH
jgi:dephospho-CoA kinase